jgi:hypothetical protein
MQTDGSAPLGCFVLNEPRPAVEREQVRERLAARIERGQMEGDVPEDTDARQLSSYLVAVMAGMSARARDGGSPAEVRAIAELALGAILRPRELQPALRRATARVGFCPAHS